MMRNLGTKLFVVLICAIATGCSTSYQKMGFTGGVEELQLSENAWRVTGSGNGFTSREKVANFVLLRSADLATQNGYKYFIFVDQQQWNENQSVYTPQQSHYRVGKYFWEHRNIKCHDNDNRRVLYLH
jgi:hypothetical protein